MWACTRARACVCGCACVLAFTWSKFSSVSDLSLMKGVILQVGWILHNYFDSGFRDASSKSEFCVFYCVPL